MSEAEGLGPERGWTAEKEAMFFEALAATCNVRKSALAAGMDSRRAYDRRVEDPLFDQRWQAARSSGFLRVEERVVLDALGETDEENGARPMSASERELALNLLKFHHGAVGRPHAGGTPPKRSAQEETDAAILAKLAVLKRRLGG